MPTPTPDKPFLCPSCGYQLDGLTVAADGKVTCPECGNRINRQLATRTKDTSLCPSCGFNIRGLNFVEEKAMCPECGENVNLTALKSVPRARLPYWGALIPIGAWAAMTSLCLLLNVSNYSGWLAFVIFVLYTTILIGPPLTFFQVNRVRWRLIRRERPMMILLGLGFSLLSYLVFAGVWAVMVVISVILRGI